LADLDPEEEFDARIMAWRGMMLGDDDTPHRDAIVVLRDLRDFCHGSSTTAVDDVSGRRDPLAMAELEGRRQVWLRITMALFLKDESLASTRAELGDYK